MQPVAVLAGGLGTRVAHLTGSDLPKALLPLDGRTFIDVKLEELLEQGVEEVVLLVAHGASILREHLGGGAAHGLRIRWHEDGPSLLGTGGALRAALDLLPDVFWVTYGDTLLEVAMAEVEDAMSEHDDIMMTVLPNADRWETSNAQVSDGRLTAYRKGDPPGTHTHLDYGMLLMRRRAFDRWRPGDVFDLGEVIGGALEAGRVAAFEVSRRFYDVGTEESYETTKRYLAERRARA